MPLKKIKQKSQVPHLYNESLIKHTNISSTDLGQGLCYIFLVEVKEGRTAQDNRFSIYNKPTSRPYVNQFSMLGPKRPYIR